MTEYYRMQFQTADGKTKSVVVPDANLALGVPAIGTMVAKLTAINICGSALTGVKKIESVQETRTQLIF